MISDVHHVGIAVRDLDQAYVLFRDVLGLPLVHQAESPARGAKVGLLRAGGSFVELVQPVADGSPFARHIEDNGEGLHHLGLWTDSIDPLVEELVAEGVAMEDLTPRQGSTGRVAFLLPEAMSGPIVELVQPQKELPTGAQGTSITRIDHVVLRVPDPGALCEKFERHFGVPTKRIFQRGDITFAFMRPGDVIIEVIGPSDGSGDAPGRIAGLAFEVKGIDDLAASLKAAGYPAGEPHPALQGGRIVSVHHTGAFGVPLAFIDFTGSEKPAPRGVS